ncbi:MAG: MFS transporter [Akkermansiaceae bacterium]|nr:MFS transporter [Akkermansiaceae bacterium]
MIPKRSLLVFGTFLLSLLLYVDRTCISLAKDSITKELGLTNEHWAWVLAAFAFGYALFQTPGGMMADQFGARIVLSVVVTVWSIFTGLSALAWNLTSLLVIRFLFGAGEAGAFPGMAKVVYSWIPIPERGLVKGINFSGSRFGAAIAMPGIAWLIHAIGWKLSFVVLMVIGFVWALFWWRWFRDEPKDHQAITKAELDYILSNRQKVAPTVPLSPDAPAAKTTKMLASGNLWLMMTQYFASNFTFFFSLTWLYPYVKEKYQLTTVDAGFYAMAPLIAGAIGNIFSGWLVDALYRRGHASLSRKIPAIIGFALAGLGMLMSADQATAEGAIIWLSIAIFGADMTLSPSWSFCIDIGGKHAGAVSGTMNMAGNLGAAITALAFFYLPSTSKSSGAFFQVAAGLSTAAIVCWIFANRDKTITQS